MLDVVNEDDRVVGKAKKSTVYKKLLTHRIVRVLIFNKKGQMALQLRSKNVSFCPSHWCSSASGHVQSGESYKEAALRECMEEIGISPRITFLYKDIYKLENGLIKIITTFKAFHEGPFKLNSREVEDVKFFSLRKIKDMMKKGVKFHPELKFLLEKYFMVYN